MAAETSNVFAAKELNEADQNPITSGDNNTDENNTLQPDYKIECEEINKRSIGKAIIKFYGNEGKVNNKNDELLRRLLQAVISHVEEEHSDTWRNAEIRIYDENFQIYSIKAGQGKNMFMVSLDENDEPKVIKTKPSRVYSRNKQRHYCVLM